MGRSAPEQPECDVFTTAIWLGQAHLFHAKALHGLTGWNSSAMMIGW